MGFRDAQSVSETRPTKARYPWNFALSGPRPGDISTSTVEGQSGTHTHDIYIYIMHIHLYLYLSLYIYTCQH